MLVYRKIDALMAVVEALWFYVGLTDEAVEGEFRLPDGRLFNSADTSQMGKWHLHQPNNWANSEDAVQLYKSSKTLLDMVAHNIDYGICEICVYEC